MLRLNNAHHLKRLSLEDRVYFTLRDIVLNVQSDDEADFANYFNETLSSGVRYEERTAAFAYANVLHDAHFVNNLVEWMLLLEIGDMETETESSLRLCETENHECMDFDAWWAEFEDLKKTLVTRRNELWYKTFQEKYN